MTTTAQSSTRSPHLPVGVVLAELSRRYGVGLGAARVALAALQATRGDSANFDHPELGGRGTWMSGLILIEDAHDHRLKARVDGLFTELSEGIRSGRLPGPPTAIREQSQSMSGWLLPQDTCATGWWPITLGTPDATFQVQFRKLAHFRTRKLLAVNDRGQFTLHHLADQEVLGADEDPGTGLLRVRLASGHALVNDLPIVA